PKAPGAPDPREVVAPVRPTPPAPKPSPPKPVPPKPVPPKPAAPRAVSALVLPTGRTGRFLTDANFVTNWLVLGPFPFKADDFGGEQQQDGADHLFMLDEAKLDGSQSPVKGAAWQVKHFRDSVQAGRIDLDGLYGSPDHAAAYAVCWLDCPADMKDAQILVGSDDYIKVWVNGVLVHTYKARRRGSEWDQDTIKGIALRRGLNRIVVKCVDVVDKWDFYLRLADGDGRPIAVTPGSREGSNP
ncbi:hypothetical protein HQ560_10870, partial [bacterium]|nr:hypothetical protein [bacterium]